MPEEPEPPLADPAAVPAVRPPGERARPVEGSGPGWRLQAAGVLLFLFIPLVLVLFVRHPEPVAGSLAAGLVLMLGHRFLARPYMARAASRKCLWCNRILRPAGGEPAATLDLLAGGHTVTALCCGGHREPAARFFRCLYLTRLPLRLGIFVPLLLLLAALAAAAAGQPRELAAATAAFQLLIGFTVSAAAWGPLLVRSAAAGATGAADTAAVPVPFPAHNFFLLGVRLLLWIFRLVGAWWIYLGLRFFLA